MSSIRGRRRRETVEKAASAFAPLLEWKTKTQVDLKFLPITSGATWDAIVVVSRQHVQEMVQA